MSTTSRSNPLYYSPSSMTTNQSIPIRTVVLHKRPDHDGFGVFIGEDIPTGLYIVTVESNSPATDGGIQPGDRVIAINGLPVAAMAKSPKSTLIRTATDAETLTLTIQAGHVLTSLDETPVKINKPTATKNQIHHPQPSERGTKFDHPQPPQRGTKFDHPQPSQRGAKFDNDLEKYIISLFSDPRLHIVPASSHNTNEYILTTDPHYTSSKDSFNRAYGLPSYRSSYHTGEHRPHHRHHRKHVRRESKETQTSGNELPPQTPPYRLQPNMGTAQILRNRVSSTFDNDTPEQEEHPNKDDKPRTITAAQVHEAPISPVQSDTSEQSPKHSKKGTLHMVDVVSAAMAAARHQESAVDVEEEPERPPTPQPPPYSPTIDNASLATPLLDRRSTSEGSYNVRSAENNRQAAPPAPIVIPSSLRGERIREVHLHRAPDFEGFGFHLQYNKFYYLVCSVEPHSPAQQGDLRTDDTILWVNGQLTKGVSHKAFVDIVNKNQHVALLVQDLEEFSRVNTPPPPRNHSDAPPPQQSLTATPSAGRSDGDSEKPKNLITKTLNKLTSR